MSSQIKKTYKNKNVLNETVRDENPNGVTEQPFSGGWYIATSSHSTEWDIIRLTIAVYVQRYIALKPD